MLQASEGKALLLPAELELLHQRKPIISSGEHQEGLDVPEELFRRYTETDSRPASPAVSVEPTQLNDDDLDGCTRETLRTTLVLDLRASSHEIQENETLSWRALTLEPIPSSRRTDLSSSQRRKPVSSRNRSTTALSTSPVRSVPVLEVSAVLIIMSYTSRIRVNLFKIVSYRGVQKIRNFQHYAMYKRPVRAQTLNIYF